MVGMCEGWTWWGCVRVEMVGMCEGWRWRRYVRGGDGGDVRVEMVECVRGWKWWGCVRVEVHIHVQYYYSEMWLCERVEVMVY